MEEPGSMNTTSVDPPPVPGVDYFFGGLLFLCFLVGVPANLFSFWCFLAQRRSVSSIVYTCISGVDCLILLNSFPVAVTYVMIRDNAMFQSEVYCNIWGVMQRLLSSLSIFYVAVLSLSRTFVLLLPFRRLKMEVVLGTIAVHFVLQIVVASIPYWESGGHFVYFEGFANCEQIVTPNNKYEKLSNVLNEIIYSIPIFPITLSCVVSVFILMRDADQLQDEQRDTKRYASVTIVLFTFTYIIFNLGSRILNIFGLAPAAAQLDPSGYLLNFLYYVTIVINAAMNPVLYFIRMHSLRNSMKSAVLNIWKRGSIAIDKNMLSIAAPMPGKHRVKLRNKARLSAGGGFERSVTPRIGETVILPSPTMSANINLGRTVKISEHNGNESSPEKALSLPHFAIHATHSHERLENSSNS